MYQRGAPSIAEQLNMSLEEAQGIIDDFYKSFPKVKNYITDTQAFCRKNGYVEDLWGRRRRLPDILLPKYEIKETKASESSDFNPLFDCNNLYQKAENPKIELYRNKLNLAKSKRDYDQIKEQAAKDGITIHDNSGFIASAERQCVNARIQGGAATMTKIAMIKIYKDKILNDLGFKLVLAVHDELIGECPSINKDAAADRLCEVMKTAVDDICSVPFKCDADIATCWYLNDYQDVVRNEFEKKLKDDSSVEEAFKQICEERPESTEDQMRETLEKYLSIV